MMKPDIIFFGEQLPDLFHDSLARDREEVDLLIVMGSSLKVAPVSEIMGHIPHSIPQVVINKTPILHMQFDVQLIGDSDVIVAELCRRLEWDLVHPSLPGGRASLGPDESIEFVPPNFHLFRGADMSSLASDDVEDDVSDGSGPCDRDGKELT